MSLLRNKQLRADELDEKVAKLHVLSSSPLLRNKQFLYVSRFKALPAWALSLLSCKVQSRVFWGTMCLCEEAGGCDESGLRG